MFQPCTICAMYYCWPDPFSRRKINSQENSLNCLVFFKKIIILILVVSCYLEFGPVTFNKCLDRTEFLVGEVLIVLRTKFGFLLFLLFPVFIWFFPHFLKPFCTLFYLSLPPSVVELMIIESRNLSLSLTREDFHRCREHWDEATNSEHFPFTANAHRAINDQGIYVSQHIRCFTFCLLSTRSLNTLFWGKNNNYE